MTELSEFQRRADETLLSWPEVRAKQVFGHRGFVVGRKMFAFFADDGFGVKADTESEREALYAREGVRPFAYGSMEMRQWPILPLASETDLADALTAASQAMERVRE